ncbi:MAG: purine-nucleoside phosphorylase, partial [Firmicutes bacterium]|nr:purine-nucleoside phosphorylase [Bacillota bacterium]
AIRTMGGDCVGMSTVPEALTAAHCGMPLLGLSLMTNMATGVTAEKVDHNEVGATAASVEVPFKEYVKDILMHM